MSTRFQHDVNTLEVEKRIIQEKINQVTRHVETLLLQIVEKTFEIPELQFSDKVVEILVATQRQSRMNREVQKTIEIPQLQHTDDVINVPVVSVVQAPLVRAVMKTVETPRMQIMAETTEISQLPRVEKIAMIPEIQTIQGFQTS